MRTIDSDTKEKIQEVICEYCDLMKTYNIPVVVYDSWEECKFTRFNLPYVANKLHPVLLIYGYTQPSVNVYLKDCLSQARRLKTKYHRILRESKKKKNREAILNENT